MFSKNGFRKWKSTFHHKGISYRDNGNYMRITKDMNYTFKLKSLYFIYNDLIVKKYIFIVTYWIYIPIRDIKNIEMKIIQVVSVFIPFQQKST